MNPPVSLGPDATVLARVVHRQVGQFARTELMQWIGRGLGFEKLEQPALQHLEDFVHLSNSFPVMDGPDMGRQRANDNRQEFDAGIENLYG